ncbi:MAG: Endoribonuclease [Gemmatimonadetes bacterium]|nr:Endoribonuclease [Gemmatimonadota bacterium]
MTSTERRWQPITLPDIPPPVGAYSPALRAGNLVFVSGQVPRDLDNGEMAPENVAEQTRQVLRNVERTLAAAGATLADVVSVTVYLSDIQDWDTFNDVYKTVFSPPYPTRTALGAGLHGFLVEISCIAYLP